MMSGGKGYSTEAHGPPAASGTSLPSSASQQWRQLTGQQTATAGPRIFFTMEDADVTHEDDYYPEVKTQDPNEIEQKEGSRLRESVPAR